MPIGEGIDEQSIRNYYHLQFSQPRLVELFSNVGTYWEKDDHDYRWNDCDTTDGDRMPSHELGIRMFKEQLPVVDPDDYDEVTYKTYGYPENYNSGWWRTGITGAPITCLTVRIKPYGAKEQKEWLKRTLEGE